MAAANSYIEGVLDGTIVTSIWIKKAIERGINDRNNGKYKLKYEEVEEVYEFCSRLNIPNSKGKIEQFRLSPYQSWMLLELFLYYEDDDSRRYTEVVYFTGRKSGKTMIAAIISFYLAILGGYYAPQVYFAASGARQAGILLEYCKQVRDKSRFLSARTEEYAYKISTSNKGFFAVTANKVGGENDGLKPLVTVLDECHALKDNQLRNAFKSGMGWSTDTLFISISTAGVNILSFFKKQVDNAKRVLEDGDYIDDKTLYFLYTLDDGDLERDDIKTNYDLHMKSNPNLGITPPLKKHIADLNQAWSIDEEKAMFIVKNLNVFDDTFSIAKLFSMPDINRNSKKLDMEDFYGSTLYLGLDLAPRIDISAIGAVVEKDGQFYSWADLFCSGSKDALFRKGTTLNLAEYSDHININWHSEVTNYEDIIDRVEWYSKHFNLISVGFDPAYSGTMASSIERIGVDTFPVKQYHASFNEPVMMFENLLATDGLTLDNNPLVKYMFHNTLMDENNQGMRMPAKKESKINGDAIDSTMAIMMAFNMYLGFNVEKSAVYQFLQNYISSR